MIEINPQKIDYTQRKSTGKESKKISQECIKVR